MTIENAATDKEKAVYTGNNYLRVLNGNCGCFGFLHFVRPDFLEAFAISFGACVRLSRQFPDLGSPLFPNEMCSWIFTISPRKRSSRFVESFTPLLVIPALRSAKSKTNHCLSRHPILMAKIRTPVIPSIFPAQKYLLIP
jgi:hypothetical protein